MLFKSPPLESRVLSALKNVHENVEGEDIVSSGMVWGVQISKSGEVIFMISADPQKSGEMEELRQRAEQAAAAVKGVKKVTAVLTAEKTPAAEATMPQSSPLPKQTAQSDPHGMNKNPPLTLPIKKIIAVASGKGGVGKSTVANALARGLAGNSQLKIGILDADIYGPSQIILSGLKAKKPETDKGGKIVPPILNTQTNEYGIKVMSIALMVDAGKALVWRGPMVQSAIYQLLRDVKWGETGEELDILIIDMPPGTGDAQLTLAQKVPVDGAIIVSTPQDLALADARKGIEMFNATDVRVLGLIENMSTHICTNCGHEEHIFGHGGAREEAEKLGVPFLGEIPLSLTIREAADAGEGFDLPDDIVTALKKEISF